MHIEINFKSQTKSKDPYTAALLFEFNIFTESDFCTNWMQACVTNSLDSKEVK